MPYNRRRSKVRWKCKCSCNNNRRARCLAAAKCNTDHNVCRNTGEKKESEHDNTIAGDRNRCVLRSTPQVRSKTVPCSVLPSSFQVLFIHLINSNLKILSIYAQCFRESRLNTNPSGVRGAAIIKSLRVFLRVFPFLRLFLLVLLSAFVHPCS